jgi:hypothetical protein
VAVRIPATLRGPIQLATLSASYVLGRPIATLVGAPRLLRLALAPACTAWSIALAATGAAEAYRVGMRVRGAPILRSRPALLASDDELVPVVSLVSDTHVVAPGRVPFELVHDPKQWPHRELPTSAEIARALRRVLADIRRYAPTTVVWCGDEVDTGDPREWSAWRELVDAEPLLAHRLVPGNHDLCFNRPFDEDYALARRAIRERAYQAHAGRLADFPIVDTIVTAAGLAHVVLLDSCRHRSKHVLSNAIGRIGDDQLDELERQLARLRGPLMCVTHHHVWREAKFAELATVYETAVDADRLIAILGAYRRRGAANHVLACHGHRHIMTAGVVGDRDAEIAVVGLPSTTLGDKSNGGVLDCVPRYAIAGLRRDGSWGVAMRAISIENVARTSRSLPTAVTDSSRARVTVNASRPQEGT